MIFHNARILFWAEFQQLHFILQTLVFLFCYTSARNWVYWSVFACPMRDLPWWWARSLQVTRTPSRRVPPRSPNLPASVTGNASVQPSAWRPTHSARALKVGIQTQKLRASAGQCTAITLVISCVFLPDAGALADPALEERGFPPDILMEEMIPTLKLVIRAVRSGMVDRRSF